MKIIFPLQAHLFSQPRVLFAFLTGTYYNLSMKNSVLCLGNIAYDLIAKTKSDNAPFRFDAYPGGSVFNTALLLSKMKCPVLTLAKTGKDFLGTQLISTMKKHKLSTRYVFQDNNVKTAIALAKLDKKGNSSYVFYRAQNTAISLKHEKIPDSVFTNAGVLHIGSAFTYKDVTFEDTIYFLNKAKNHKVFISYDPNWRSRRIREIKNNRACL